VQLDRQRRLRSSGRVPFAFPAYSHFRRSYVPLVLTLPTYLRADRTYTSSVLTRYLYSHSLRGFVVLAVSIKPGVILSQSSHTPCVGSLSSQYPSRRVCTSSRLYSHALYDPVGLLTRLAWAHCSHGIHHTRRGHVAVFSHALYGIGVPIGVGGHCTCSRIER